MIQTHKNLDYPEWDVVMKNSIHTNMKIENQKPKDDLANQGAPRRRPAGARAVPAGPPMRLKLTVLNASMNGKPASEGLGHRSGHVCLKQPQGHQVLALEPWSQTPSQQIGVCRLGN